MLAVQYGQQVGHRAELLKFAYICVDVLQESAHVLLVIGLPGLVDHQAAQSPLREGRAQHLVNVEVVGGCVETEGDVLGLPHQELVVVEPVQGQVQQAPEGRGARGQHHN